MVPITGVNGQSYGTKIREFGHEAEGEWAEKRDYGNVLAFAEGLIAPEELWQRCSSGSCQCRLAKSLG